MITAERTYRLLLRAYPARFRAAYEQQMLIVFRDMRRERRSGPHFWSRIMWDTLCSAPVIRLETSLARWNEPSHHNGAIMKTTAILAMLVGALTIANASVEGWVGGVAGHDSQTLVVGGLGVLAGASVVMAGLLLLRRSAGATKRAQVAAMVCLASFVLILVLNPRLSIFANILGIGTPLLLVAWLQVQRGRGRSTPLVG